MTNHCMTDIETLATRPGGIILSIGSVVFDPVKGTLGPEFYMRVLLKSCIDLGLKLDTDTLIWWIEQSDEARKEAFSGERHPIRVVLTEHNIFYSQNFCTNIWSHGAAFDIPIIETPLRGLQIKPAWGYRDIRDTRTLFDLSGVKLDDHVVGTKHNALDDAKGQARAVIAAYGKLGMGAGLPIPLDGDSIPSHG